MKQMFYSTDTLMIPQAVFLPVILLLDPRLSPGELRTWMLLKCLAGGGAETPPFSRAGFYRLAGILRATMYNHLDRLSAYGYLRVKKVSRYELVVIFPADLVDLELSKKINTPASLKDSFINLYVYQERLKRGAEDQIGDAPASTNPVNLYRELTHLTPNTAQREQIAARVTDLGKWGVTIQHWRAHGWNPRNLPGMLDLYQRGGPDGCRFCVKTSPLAEAFAILDGIAQQETNGDG